MGSAPTCFVPHRERGWSSPRAELENGMVAGVGMYHGWDAVGEGGSAQGRVPAGPSSACTGSAQSKAMKDGGALHVSCSWG